MALSEKDFQEILNQINSGCTTLDLSGKHFDEAQFLRLITALETNQTLTTLNLAFNSLGDEAVKALARALKTNPTLTTLGLGGNKLGDEAVKALARALENNQALTSLSLGYNNLGDEAGKALAEMLETNKILTELDLLGNKLGDEAGKALARALKTNPTLTELCLRGNKLGDEAGKAFARALETNKTLTELDLLGNKLGDEAGEALARALKTNPTLTSLNLWNNNLGDEAGEALARALKTNPTLTELDLGYNKLGGKAVKALAEMLETNQTLTELDLWNNRLGDEAGKALIEALETNQTLTKLNLGVNKLGDEAGKALAEMLENNQTLTTLNLAFNSLGDEAGKALIEALETNQTLTKLDLGGNKLGDDLTSSIGNLVKRNSKLRDDFTNALTAAINDPNLGNLSKLHELSNNIAIVHIIYALKSFVKNHSHDIDALGKDNKKVIQDLASKYPSILDLIVKDSSLKKIHAIIVSKAPTEAELARREFAEKKLIADQGDVRSQHLVAKMYEAGRGVEQNYQLSLEYYQLSAQTYSHAQYDLANKYRKGEGVKRSYNLAAQYYRLAAEQGHKDAQYYLGLMCKKGRGGTEPQEAAGWFQLAADQGHKKAQQHLPLGTKHSIPSLDDLQKKLQTNLRNLEDAVKDSARNNQGKLSKEIASALAPILSENQELSNQLQQLYNDKEAFSLKVQQQDKMIIDLVERLEAQSKVITELLQEKLSKEPSISSSNDALSQEVLNLTKMMQDLSRKYDSLAQQNLELQSQQSKQSESLKSLKESHQESLLVVEQRLGRYCGDQQNLSKKQKDKLLRIMQDYDASLGFVGQTEFALEAQRSYFAEDNNPAGRKEVNARKVALLQCSNSHHKSQIEKFHLDLRAYLHNVLFGAMSVDALGVDRVMMHGKTDLEHLHKGASYVLGELKGGDIFNDVISSLFSYYPDLKFKQNYRKLVQVCGDGREDVTRLIDYVSLSLTEIFKEQLESGQALKTDSSNHRGFSKLLKKALNRMVSTETISNSQLSEFDLESKHYVIIFVKSLLDNKELFASVKTGHRLAVNKELVDDLIAGFKARFGLPPESNAIDDGGELSNKLAKQRSRIAERSSSNDVLPGDGSMTPRTMVRKLEEKFLKQTSEQNKEIEALKEQNAWLRKAMKERGFSPPPDNDDPKTPRSARRDYLEAILSQRLSATERESFSARQRERNEETDQGRS